MKNIKIKIVFKSGRELEFDMVGHTIFREAANHLLKSHWNVFNNYAFNTNEIEAMYEVE